MEQNTTKSAVTLMVGAIRWSWYTAAAAWYKFTGNPMSLCKQPRHLCLRLLKSSNAELATSWIPDLLYAHHSPSIRSASYVEATSKQYWERLDLCKTWCVPPVRVSSASMNVLMSYIEYITQNPGDRTIRLRPQSKIRSILKLVSHKARWASGRSSLYSVCSSTA